MDLREHFDDWEEALRATFAGLMKGFYTSLPVIVKESKDGHVSKLQAAIKASVRQPNGSLKQVELPIFEDVPIHYPGGGGVTFTHPVADGDEGVAIFSSRAQDAWHQSGGVQSPVDNRMFALSDARYLPGGRSDPRKLKHVSDAAAHLRSDDGKHTIEHHPSHGSLIKSVDANDSADNPFADATKFYQTKIRAGEGIEHRAQDGGTAHRHEITHSAGHKIEANNGASSVTAHPSNGAAIAAGANKVEAKPSGLTLASPSSIDLTAPNVPITGNVSVTGALQAATAAFGGIGGIGGGAVPGNLNMAGSVAAGGQVSGSLLRSTIYTVATLPAPSTALLGARALVYDAASPTFLSIVVGGGGSLCPVYCDSVNWRAG